MCRFKCEGAALSYIKISPQVYYQLNENFRIDPNQVTISRKVMSIGHHMSENEKAIVVKFHDQIVLFSAFIF